LSWVCDRCGIQWVLQKDAADCCWDFKGGFAKIHSVPVAGHSKSALACLMGFITYGSGCLAILEVKG